MKKLIRLTESDLHRIVKESVKKALILRESSNYGITMAATLAWVQNKKPDMNQQEQKRFAFNILKKMALTTKNHWGPMGKILSNGHLLSVWDGDNVNTQYDSVGVDNVYLDGEEIGQIKHYSPLVISRDVEPFFDDIKSFNKLIASQANEGLEYDGAEYIIDDY